MSFNGRRKSIKKQSKINSGAGEHNFEKSKKINKGESLIKCIYDVKEKNEIQIINDRIGNMLNEDIEAKIKIWSNNKKEKLIYKKKFDKLGLNTIYFIIEKKLDNLNFIFNDCSSLKQIQFINPEMERVRGMKGMFNGCKNIEFIDLSSFDTSNVTDMSYLFNECHKLKEIKGIDKFNTSKVTNMRAMFQQCMEIKSLNLSSFDTSNVKDLSLNLSSFDTSNVKDLSIMFQECFELNYVDISNFKTTNVKNIGWMFNKCYKLNEIKGINILKSLKNINQTGIFEDCPNLRNIPNDGTVNKIKIDKKQITIFFVSNDQSIKNYPLTCYNTDIVETIKEKIYLINPEFKHKIFYFLANGSIINERVSLAENKIEDETVILIQEEF